MRTPPSIADDDKQMRWYGYIGAGLICSAFMVWFTITAVNLELTGGDLSWLALFGVLGFAILLIALQPREDQSR